MRDERKACCYCRRCIRDGGRTYCEVDGHYISYGMCFEDWCRHWARDKKWDKEEEMKKAWRVEDMESDVGGCTVVFAETRGKAHAMARNTDCCEDAEWTSIRVTRIPAMDKMYQPGKVEMDWSDPEDRIALVKECGWCCNHEWLIRDRDCPNCPAAEWCEDYQDWKEEEKDGSD